MATYPERDSEITLGSAEETLQMTFGSPFNPEGSISTFQADGHFKSLHN